MPRTDRDDLFYQPPGTMHYNIQLAGGGLLNHATSRYFEGLRPEPPLFGRPGKEQAMVELWNRRVELDLAPAVATAFRNINAFAPEAENDPSFLGFLELLDSELASAPAYTDPSGFNI